MVTKDVFIIRHGRTDYNEHGIVQGSGIDANLNATGQLQAQAFFDAYRDHPFEKIYTSTLRRTYQTVAPFLEEGIPYEAHPGLDEISWGHYEGYQVSKVGATYYKNLLANWNEGHTHIPIKGGESPDAVANRQRPLINQLREASQQCVLLCMHGRAMRVLLCQLLNEPLYRMDAYPHGNLSLYHIRLNQHGAGIGKVNCRKHLEKQPLNA